MLAESGSNLLRRQPPYGIYAYTGREWDPEINLHYYRARYYEPKVGRFLSEDPLGVAKPHPDNRVAMAVAREHNLYVYVSSNPIRFTDPLGLKRTKFPPSPPQCKLPTPVQPNVLLLRRLLSRRAEVLYGDLPPRRLF